jgi:dolichyl-phosphate beta-glucosyltransferase
VVDDGSRDRTADVARDAFARSIPDNVRTSVLVNPQNRGKGYSIRRGVLAAAGRLALVSDADLSTPIEDAAKLLAALEPAGRGLAIGSRALRESNVEIHQNVLREVMGKVFNRIVRLLTQLPFHDTQCGFKLMARDDVAPILSKARIDGFSYDVELIYVAVRRGLPVREVGVTWRNAPGSKVGMLSDPLRMLRDVWRVRSWYRQGLYDAP